MYEKQLSNFGLTEKQAQIYEILLNLGPSSITPIIKRTKLKKGDVYNILKALKEFHLLRENQERKKTIFRAEQPQNLQKLMIEKEKRIASDKVQLQNILPELTSLFQQTTERPIIQIFNGIEETKIFYNDLMTTKSEVLIFVSRYDWDDPKMEKLIKSNTLKQFNKGIKIRALNPLLSEFSKRERKNYVNERKRKNIKIRFLPKNCAFPSQIIIYDNKVGITSMKKELITTVIENDNIAQTVKSIFNFTWDSAKSFHDASIK
ncbi:helix-turn-helix domain-containing protein [Patescibacteria group bacterium]|nr:helix-turn-helix domain-containing protein [Patescibacteria group bacterium]